MSKETATAKGYKTSEFWVTTIGSLLVIILSSGIFDNSPQIAGLIAGAITVLGYAGGRSLVKSSQIKSEALGSLAKMGKPE